MLDAAQQAADFKRALDNIKSRNIQAVAARMCRVLREFPKDCTPRKTVIDNDGSQDEIDLSGSLFDSVWEENVGSKIAKNMALTPNLAIDAVEALYKLNVVLVEHGAKIITGTDISTLSPDFVTVYNRVYRMLISPEYTATPTLTYTQKGFVLNPEIFTEADESSETVGIYELGKYLSRTDIITQLRVMHGYVSSKEWVESTTASVSTAITYATRIETAVLCVIDTILDIAHTVDAIATCKDLVGGDEIDLASFDPELSKLYREIPAV